MNNYQDIITIEPGKRGGRPTIRGMRIAVNDVLSWLAAGMTHEEIIGDYPELSEDDIRDCVAEQVNTNLFLEAKFRPTLRVNNARIQSYYKEVLVPELKKKGAAVPPLEQVSTQIEQILAEQTLNDLFTEWMKGLRGQARLRMIDTTLKPRGFETPSSLSGMNFLPLRISDERAAQSSPAASTTPASTATPQQR